MLRVYQKMKDWTELGIPAFAGTSLTGMTIIEAAIHVKAK